MDSTIRLNQDHVVVTIPHPTDTTMGNYSCQFHYLDIAHNYQLIRYTSMRICNKKSCDQLRYGLGHCHRHGLLEEYKHGYRNRIHDQDNYSDYESCVYNANGCVQVPFVTAILGACLVMLALT
ncbi:unnamed protein product, partial [Oppiella nova]